MSSAQWVVAAIALFAGSGVQYVVGFGMNLLAVPMVLLVGASGLVPGPLLVVLFSMGLMLGLGEPHDVDWKLLGWFLPARVIGTIAGGYVGAVLSKDAVSVLICCLVLAAVGLSAVGWRIAPKPSSWLASGWASGFSNVLSSIGGPPLALVLVDHPPAQQRATQGWSATFGSLMSIGVLMQQSRFDSVDLRQGLILSVAAAAGALAGRPLRQHVPDARSMRPVVYGVAVIGSLAAIGRILWL